MVEAELSTIIPLVSNVATALGVCIAAIYYIMNLRISQRNQELMLKAQEQTLETRRIELIENISSRISNEDGMRSYLELMNYEWKDYVEFDRKYGSENNVEAATKRYTKWIMYNTIGMMLRRGLVDAGELYDLGLGSLPMFWEKYKSIVEETRRRYFGENYCRDMEFLAVEMLKYVQSKQPSYIIPEKLDKFDSLK